MTSPVDAGTGTLTRGLELLRLLNESYPLQVRNLHAATGLPKPTVTRLLKTLLAAGYVRRDGRLGYRPASKLNLLSAGISSQAWIQEVAAPEIDRLSKSINWPSDFAIFEGRGMALRYSTRGTAPIHLSDPINRSDIAMLDSDFGRAFLAFASDEQRTRMLAALARLDPRLDPAGRDFNEAEAIFARVRRDGYATRGENFSFARAATIAVAVTVGGQSVGALNVICGRRFVRPKDIPRRYLGELQETAVRIGRALCWDGFVVRGIAPDGAQRRRGTPPHAGKTRSKAQEDIMTHSFGRRAVLGAMAGAMASPVRARAADAPARMNIAQRLAQYVADTQYDALDPVTIETAKAHLIDAIGCGIVAFGVDSVRACRSVALAEPGGVSTVIGTARRTSPELAAFANGAAIRYYDFNDTYFGKEPGHPSDNVTACLAIAEAEGCGGRDFLLAMILAYEIDCRLMDCAELTARGWDHPIYSLPASALGAGKLMKLSPEQLTQAVNLSINSHIAMNQTRVQVLSDWKGLADAESARNGVFAALLARAGITGPSPIFEGTAGFFKQVSGPFEVDTEQFGGRKGTFLINHCDVKPYPAQGGTITAIPAAVEIAKQVGDLGQISSIMLDTADFTYRSAGRDREKWTPETKETADHSLPFVVARAMMDGTISFDSFSPQSIHDPKALALMAKMTVRPDPALTALAPKRLANRITATLADGRVLTRQVDTVPGLGGTPMQRDDFERKFIDNTEKVWSAAERRRVLDAVWSLDKQGNLDGLLRALLVPA